MEDVRKLLEQVLDETEFEVVSVRDSGGGSQSSDRRVSPSELSDVLALPDEFAGVRQLRVHAPQPSMLRLADALRCEIRSFVDPERDRIGHAFPTDSLVPEIRTRSSFSTIRPNGLVEQEFTSSVLAFATSLVRAAGIGGVERAVERLAGWVRGDPVKVHATTVLNNLHLRASVRVTHDVELVPLGLTTASLPRLPTEHGVSIEDYLGATLLKAQALASPALFRPYASDRERSVRLNSTSPLDFDVICRALSLSADRHVTWAHQWNDYSGTREFFLGTTGVWRRQGNRLQGIRYKRLGMDLQTGALEVEPSDDIEFQCLDVNELRAILQALPRADKKLAMAIDRWSRSKNPDIGLADRYIDLRIALESLYLKDFRQDKAPHTEMRFRLALFGA